MMEKDLTFEQNMMPCQAEFNHMDSGEGKITHQERPPGSILPFMEDPQEQMLKIIYNEMVENKKSIDELQLIVRENTEGLHGVKKYLSGCVIKQDENVLIQMIRHEIEQYLKMTDLSPNINKEGFALLSQMVSYSYELEEENKKLKELAELGLKVQKKGMELINIESINNPHVDIENIITESEKISDEAVKFLKLKEKSKKKRGRPKK